MRADRRRDHHRVDRIVGEHILEARDLPDADTAGRLLDGLRPCIAHGGELGVRRLDDVTHELRPPVAEPDDGDTHGVTTSPVAEDLQRRPREQAQIEPQRPAAGVGVEVEGLDEGRPRPRRHLPETGDAGRDEEALEVVRGEGAVS